MSVNIGDKVVVLSCPKYNNELKGDIGVVQRTDGDNVTITVEGKYNKNSQKGYYYFPNAYLAKVNEYNCIEDDRYSNNIAIINDINKYNAEVDMSYPNLSHSYSCIVNDAKIDDMIIFKAQNKFFVGKIVEFSCGIHGDNYKNKVEFITKVDLKPYLERKKIEKEIIELNKELKERADKVKESLVYDFLSEKDEEFKEMLNKLRYLENKIIS